MQNDKPVANPIVVLREEFDDWAVLFDPDTGSGYAIDPVSVFIWKRLDGRHTVDEIVSEIKKSFEEVPGDADQHCRDFIEGLVKGGLAGFEVQTV